MKRVLIGTWLTAGLAIAACTTDEMPQAADGRGLYMEYCSVCHGSEGKGDGELARSMSVAPKDLTLITVRHGDEFPRAEVLSMNGGARIVSPESLAASVLEHARAAKELARG